MDGSILPKNAQENVEQILPLQKEGQQMGDKIWIFVTHWKRTEDMNTLSTSLHDVREIMNVMGIPRKKCLNSIWLRSSGNYC